MKALAALLNAFSEHEATAPLKVLQNEDTDLDFFANFTHIQTHRRQRAIHRLVEGLESGEVSEDAANRCPRSFSLLKLNNASCFL